MCDRVCGRETENPDRRGPGSYDIRQVYCTVHRETFFANISSGQMHPGHRPVLDFALSVWAAGYRMNEADRQTRA